MTGNYDTGCYKQKHMNKFRREDDMKNPLEIQLFQIYAHFTKVISM